MGITITAPTAIIPRTSGFQDTCSLQRRTTYLDAFPTRLLISLSSPVTSGIEFHIPPLKQSSSVPKVILPPHGNFSFTRSHHHTTNTPSVLLNYYHYLHQETILSTFDHDDLQICCPRNCEAQAIRLLAITLSLERGHCLYHYHHKSNDRQGSAYRSPIGSPSIDRGYITLADLPSFHWIIFGRSSFLDTYSKQIITSAARLFATANSHATSLNICTHDYGH